MKPAIVKIVAAGVFACLLGACSSGSEDEEPQGAIHKPQLQVLDKARGTEQLLQDAEEQRRKQMEEQGI
jgi:hypothetical protein